MARYLIGIDLGTTNSALAYVDTQQRAKLGRPEIHTFPIPQLVMPGECKERELLPSFLYLPGPHDLPAGSVSLPWDSRINFAVGEFARNHGARVPGRLVTSAKSWLCHAGVDRSAAILPWNAPPDVPRISPVEASARYLRHMVASWNHHVPAGKEEDRLEKQAIVLTVPASFDDVARNLTLEAARQAGFENITLLEEPQAAFYCWLATHSPAEASRLKPGYACLIVDVGGGTSDFSLIRAAEAQGELTFIREAVGDHLLLGGDNMDLALAKLVETRLPGSGRIDVAQYGMLTQACRSAKEVLLAPNAPASFTVSVMGRGRQVVGGSVHVNLSPTDVRKTVFEGFLPTVRADAEPARGARTGLHEIGLPYVTDAAITRHLAAFLQRHTTPTDVQAAQCLVPQAILFNGGVFQPAILRERLVDVMRGWFDSKAGDWQPLVLTNPSLDLAVAWGAAYFGWLKHTGGRRIGGGIARSYYVGVELGQEASKAAGKATVVCVVPQHLEEGSEIVLQRPELELALGQPVLFPLFTSTVRGDDKAGDLLQVEPNQLLRMPPLHTILRGGKRSGTRRMPVTLAAKSTEIGTLEIWCVAREGSNRWRLEFNVRDIVKDDLQATPAEPAQTRITDVLPEAQIQAAGELIRDAFTNDVSKTGPQELTKALETLLEAPRNEWPSGLCRRLWEFLAEVVEERRRSPAHRIRWYYLTGFCLRPGFGDSLDRFRVEQLWKLLQTPARDEAGKVVPRVPEGSADYWIMWRRVAGGLNVSLQQALFERLRSVLMPTKTKAVAKPGSNELAEMWRAAASLERLDPKHKEALGQPLLKQVRRSPVPTHAFWALTRLGARVLLYGPLNTVLHHQIAEQWLETMLEFSPGNDSERLSWAFCLTQLARRTGQLAFDVDDTLRARVLERLQSLSVPGHWLRVVEEVADLDREDESEMFGEALPMGLRLLQT